MVKYISINQWLVQLPGPKILNRSGVGRCKKSYTAPCCLLQRGAILRCSDLIYRNTGGAHSSEDHIDSQRFWAAFQHIHSFPPLKMVRKQLQPLVHHTDLSALSPFLPDQIPQ